MAIFDLLTSSANDAARQVLGFTRARMKVLTNDVANIDTPGYRMRDLSKERFESELGRAIDRSKDPGPDVGKLDLPDPAELDAADGAPAHAGDLRGVVFHDDNDRFIEKLIVEMRKNADRHGQAANLLRKQNELLRAVISESAS